MKPRPLAVIYADDPPCAKCHEMEARIADLEQQIERLTYAVQRDSTHYERRAAHGKPTQYEHGPHKS